MNLLLSFFSYLLNTVCYNNDTLLGQWMWQTLYPLEIKCYHASIWTQNYSRERALKFFNGQLKVSFLVERQHSFPDRHFGWQRLKSMWVVDTLTVLFILTSCPYSEWSLGFLCCFIQWLGPSAAQTLQCSVTCAVIGSVECHKFTNGGKQKLKSPRPPRGQRWRTGSFKITESHNASHSV